MNKNQKVKLLTQDLIGRQLYGLKFQCVNSHGKTVIQTLETVIGIGNGIYKVQGNKEVVDIDNCLPFLFPYKCSEETVEIGGRVINILDVLSEEDIIFVQHRDTWIRTWEYDIIDYTRYFDVLDQFHIDYRGLIRANLAIEINKSNNPY